jgi:hypothetical protein
MAVEGCLYSSDVERRSFILPVPDGQGNLEVLAASGTIYHPQRKLWVYYEAFSYFSF